MAPTIKLFYFTLPGRGEVTRMLLNYGGLKFTEQNFGFDEWTNEWKAKMDEMAYGQVPVMEVDGKVLAQSGAMERYVAKLAGVYPSDPWEAAKVDEAVGLVMDAQDALYYSASAKMSPDEKAAARKEVVEGSLKTKLAAVIKLLSKAGGHFLTGPNVTYADFVLFKAICGIASGTMDGVPANTMDAYPELKAFHARFAALPAIAKMYEAVEPGPKMAYKQLP